MVPTLAPIPLKSLASFWILIHDQSGHFVIDHVIVLSCLNAYFIKRLMYVSVYCRMFGGFSIMLVLAWYKYDNDSTNYVEIKLRRKILKRCKTFK